MRLLFMLVLVAHCSLAFAQAEGVPCRSGKLSCKISAPWTGNGLVHATMHPIEHANENAGTYYARGSGKSCNEAYSNALRRLMDTYSYLVCGGEVKCGTNGTAYLLNQSCNATPDGTRYAWVKCSNLFHSPSYSAPQNDKAAGFVLLQSLMRDEKRNGNR